jgi:hypothetical protein
VAEELDGEVVGAGQVRFGFAGKGLWAILDELRAGSLDRAGVVPIEPGLVVRVKYFGRHLTTASAAATLGYLGFTGLCGRDHEVPTQSTGGEV